MKALALVTHTNNCESLWRSFESLGHECHAEVYDDRPHSRHNELVDLAVSFKPDLIIYIGAIEKYHNRPVPYPDILCRLREIAPSVHICGDASCHTWWEPLQEYDDKQCFTVQVSIDGSHNTPIAKFKNGIILLTPTDPRAFEPQIPWDEKDIKCGYVGGLSPWQRQEVVRNLTQQGLLQHIAGSPNRSYARMGKLMNKMKISFNMCINGAGDNFHVKGRVIEAGFAGSCLMEQSGATTAQWFSPGQDYLEYMSIDHAARIIKDVEDDVLRGFAQRFQKKVREQHHPKVFWDKVLAKCTGDGW